MLAAIALINFVRGFPTSNLFRSASSTMGIKLLGSGNGLGNGSSCFFAALSCCVIDPFPKFLHFIPLAGMLHVLVPLS